MYDLREFNTPVDALGVLRAGALDAVFTDAITFDDFVKTQSGLNLSAIRYQTIST